MTFRSVAKGQTATCVRLTTKYLACSTDVALVFLATREVHGGRIGQQRFVQILLQ